MSTTDLAPHWVSWWHFPHLGPFELHTPWWVSGHRADGTSGASVCAAVMATSEDHAQALIRAAYDKMPVTVEWRFTQRQPADWSPFGGRFERAEWMQWP